MQKRLLLTMRLGFNATFRIEGWNAAVDVRLWSEMYCIALEFR